jgi:hypothetical protein
MRMLNNKYRTITLALISSIAISTACEEEPTVNRSKDLNIYGPTTVYIGDNNTYEAPLFTLNDTRTWSWGVNGDGASISTGKGEFFDVTFNKLGTYSVILSESDRSGSVEVEAISKVLSLSGDTLDVSESFEDSEIAIPLTIDNVVAEEVAVSYTIGGTAVEGVDYELVSPNPLILDAESEEDDYAIYIRLIADVSHENEEKILSVTLNSIETTLEDEVVLAENENILVDGIRIHDDIKLVSIKNIVSEGVNNTGIVSFEVLLSATSSEAIKVNYSLTGTGVKDATPDGPGSITFVPGETSKFIYIQFNEEAFLDEQSVIVTLNSISTDDKETSLNEERNSKTFQVH